MEFVQPGLDYNPQDRNDIGIINLVQLIEKHLNEDKSRIAFTVLDDKGNASKIIYSEKLWDEVIKIAIGLQKRVKIGEAVLLVLPTGDEFICAFLGCLMAGVLPVPLPVPRHLRDVVGFERFVGAARVTDARAVIAEGSVHSRLKTALPGLTYCDVSELSLTEDSKWQAPNPAPESAAYIQFTSGSCGTPRGVVVTHAATLSNVAIINRVFDHNNAISILSWLPLHHDMGLVGHVLFPIFSGVQSILMPTSSFSRNPIQWLETIARYNVTTSGAPAFAYEMCIAALENQGFNGDLRGWKNAYVGADMVPPEVLKHFAEAFSPYGFRAESWLPCYGLAEATLFVAGGHESSELVVDADRLARGFAVDVEDREIQSLAEGVRSRRSLMGYGVDFRDYQIKIVHPQTLAECAEREVGEVWIRGASLGNGYYRNPKATKEIFCASLAADSESSYLRTGDLGFLIEDRLFLTGRYKDLIIVRGVNHDPYDLERTVLAADPGPAYLRAVCFAINNKTSDRIIILREVRSQSKKDIRLNTIAERIVEAHAIAPDGVYFVPPGSIARTSSGKTARSKCRDAFLAGEMKILASLVTEGNTPSPSLVDTQFYPATLVSATETAENEVAVVGMACRFPLGTTNDSIVDETELEAFWNVLSQGRDCVSEIPAERWDADRYYDPRPAIPGKMNTRCGGFIRNVDRFEPDLFGISGYEAMEIDPQQRILLEVAWRAFEHAGIPLSKLRGSNTGVFIGISNGDYLRLMVRARPGFEQMNAYSALGNATSVAANRLSYVFDLQGPSIAVDTACSSSLTAIHLASESIRNGECDLAIAGGINLLLAADLTILLSQFGMMAPDGRCKTFDTEADGYVRSEGCGLVVLKGGSAARADRDSIYAWIRGSSQGQDGRSSGITAPNPQAQYRLLQRALARSCKNPEQITYIEAHGTGTAIGDPAEMKILRSIYGGKESGSTCYVGSVKANIGHLEAAAGVAGFIKVILAMQHHQIPQQIHLKRLNPAIDIEGSRLKIATETTEWLPSETPRQAAISSFGFGGALVHMILEEEKTEAIQERTLARRGNHHQLLLLSAQTPEAFDEIRHDWIQCLKKQPIESLKQLCHASVMRRTHFRYRAALVDSAPSGMRQRLANIEALDSEREIPADVGIAFLFSGQGERFVGMGKHLYANYEVFRESFDRCAVIFDTNSGTTGIPPLQTIVFGEADKHENEDNPKAELARLDFFCQPALFALEYALAQLWLSWGIAPSIVCGHSLGEIVAACIADCMDLEDAMRLVICRGELINNIPGEGGMLTIFTDERQVGNIVDLETLSLSIAVLNSPSLTVISGPQSSIKTAYNQVAEAGIKARNLPVVHAFHSAMMDPILADFKTAISQIEFRPPTLPFVSSATGQVMRSAPTPQYWCDHLRYCVRFKDTVDTLVTQKVRRFVEIGPGRVLSRIVQQCYPELNGEYLTSLDEEEAGLSTIFNTLGRLFVSGFEVDWNAIYRDPVSMPASLPHHPFRHRSFWFDNPQPLNDQEDLQSQTSLQSTQPGAAVFGLEWNSRPLPPSPTIIEPVQPLHWIVVGDGSGFSDLIAQGIEAKGESVFLLRPSGKTRLQRSVSSLFKRHPIGDIKIPMPCTASDYATAINQVLNSLSRYDSARWQILYIAGLDGDIKSECSANSLREDQETIGVGGLLDLVQGIKQIALPLSLWVVTQNAQAVPSADGTFDSPLNLSQSPLWGFARTAFLEYPELRGGLIDLDGEMAPEIQIRCLLAQVENGADESQVAFRKDIRYVQQFKAASLEANSSPLAIDAHARYVITGGMGGLGLECALWLAKRGAKNLVLVGRSTPPPRNQWHELSRESRWHQVIEKVKEIEACGTSVEMVACDVRDYAGLEQVLTSIRRRSRIGGAIHAAGVNWFGKIRDLDRAKLLEAMEIKVSAAWHLHELTLEDHLDFFILFSSVSALWGSVDLAHYTASNHFLDALCYQRRKLGQPALSINWGPWAEVGMSAQEREENLLSMLGLKLIPPQDALNLMERVLVENITQCTIAEFDWERFRNFVDFSLSPSLFEPIQVSSQNKTISYTANVKELAALSSVEAYQSLLALLRRQVSSVLLMSPGSEIDENTRFNFMGMDSLMAITFCARLEAQLGFEIPAMTAYNYPTLKKMAEFLYERIRGLSSSSESQIDVSVAMLFSFDIAPSSKFRLFCFPYAGAGPSVFADWNDPFPDYVSIIPLQLPGRENRLWEPPITSVEELVQAIADSLESHNLHTPYGFFGHSLGALLSFEVTRELARRNLPLPQPLILSGCMPACSDPQDQIHQLDDDKFISELNRRFSIVPATGWDGDLQAALLPALRADIKMAETTPVQNSAPIACPVHIFGGRADTLAPPERLLEWSSTTTIPPSIHLFDGDHMFLRGTAKVDVIATVIDVINQRLEK